MCWKECIVNISLAKKCRHAVCNYGCSVVTETSKDYFYVVAVIAVTDYNLKWSLESVWLK